MITKPNRKITRLKRHRRIRRRIWGSTERPRLCVFRSNRHIYAQVVDDSQSITIASASTLRSSSYGVALLMITLVMIAFLGSLRSGLTGMIPNVLPIAMTLGVISRIHLQAARLWLKRVGFHSKPVAPAVPVTRQTHPPA